MTATPSAGIGGPPVPPNARPMDRRESATMQCPERGSNDLPQCGRSVCRSRVRDDHLYLRQRAQHGEQRSGIPFADPRGCGSRACARDRSGRLFAARQPSDQRSNTTSSIPPTGRPGGAIFGNSPCLGSVWGEDYFRRIQLSQGDRVRRQYDGRYPGDVRASTAHPGIAAWRHFHRQQWRRIVELRLVPGTGHRSERAGQLFSRTDPARPAWVIGK